ncbi:MAG: right-handed parallel beta-helix repeat-containing protein, partial [Bacteroidota bacterium]
MNKLPFFYLKRLCKQGKKLNVLLFIFLIVCCSSVKVQAALSGNNYTIDGSLPPSSLNYQTFASAISDMVNGTRADGGTANGSGVSGPVVFTVAAGTYSGQLDLTAITGVSATNTITFDGGAGNAATRIITYNGATSLANAFTLRINNSQYVRLYNLTIQAASAGFGWPLHILNNSSNTIVRNCILTFTTSYTTHTTPNFCALVVNNSSASPTTAGTTANNIQIDSNKIFGGYGNYIYGSGTSNNGIFFRANQVDSTNYYGLYLNTLLEAKVVGNNFTMSPSSNLNSNGIFFNIPTSNATNLYDISSNRITNAAMYGIYLSGSNTNATTRSKLNNNALAGGFRNTANPAGIYFSNNVYSFDVFHNSINFDAPATGTQPAAMFLGNCCTQGASLLDIRNNIIAVTGVGSAAYTVYMPNGYPYAVIGGSTFDYNLYYKVGASLTEAIFYSGGVNLSATTLINHSSNATFYNTNSVYRKPTFTSPTNLLPISPCNNGTGIASVTTDIMGNTRSASAPDLGAYEVTPVPNDIGVESLISPVLPFASGSQNISAVLRNYGSNTITSANISYSVNGAFPVTINYSGSLAPCATATVTFTGGNQYTFLPNTAYSIKVYSDNPNLSTDANALNDTFTIPMIFTGMVGNYTIDQASPASPSNFVSFRDAVNALNFGGVSGPVRFDVIGSTPYNEQVSLDFVPGASATNTITFEGGAGNAANRILTFAASAAAPYTFRINNTPNVIVNNLTIRGSGAGNAWPLHILGNASSNIKVKGCMIDFVGGGGVAGLNTNFVGILINNSATAVSSNSLAFNIEIDSNTITGGNMAIYAYTQNSNNYLFTNNKIINPYQYGIYAYYLTAFKCNFNTINMNPAGAVGSAGLYFNFCANTGTYAKEVNNNVITNAGQYGMIIYYLQGSSTMRSKIINNVVAGNFRSTDPSGIYMYQNSNFADIWFNSINIDNSATSTTSAALRLATSCTSLDVRNNNLAVTNANSTAFALQSDATNSFIELNYNNYYKVSPASLITLNGIVYSAGNYKGVSGYNTNSVNINPAYTSSTNLKTNLLCNQGVAIASVPTDFEGDIRGTVPDIGADENTTALANDLTVVELLNPAVPLSVGVQNLRVVIKNNGSNAITGAEISYRMNGGAPVSQTWSGNLNPCDSTVVEFNATSGPGGTDQRFKIIPGFTYSFRAYSSLPNFSTDGNTLNDTISFGPLCPALAGQFYIDSAATVAGVDTFTSFTSAALALNCGGVSGPVVFNVLKGTYEEQITLNDVVGSSAINTILFNGGAGNDSTRIITFAGQTNATRHTVLINGAKYISLRNLTIRGKGATYGWPLHILGAANNISVRNCVIDFEGLGVNAATTNFISVVVNNSTTTPTTTGTFTNIDIERNKIAGGFSNVYFAGNGANTGISFRNNQLFNADNYGAYISNIIAPKVIGNTVNMRLVSTTSTGIYLVSVITNATSNAEVIRNRVYDAGQYGIYINSNTATGLRPNMLNNSVGGKFRNTSSYNGINITSSPNWNIIYNSVLIDTPSVTATATTSGALYITGSTLLDCRNNIFSVNHVTAGANVLPFRSVSGVTFVTGGLNYNNYFKEGSPATLIQVNGTNYTSLNFNTATSGGVNSVNNNSGYVQLVTNKDIIPVTATNHGINVPSITNRDINDSLRNNPPDMGAFEIPSGLTNDLGLVASLSPDTALSSGSKQVRVVIKNYGISTIFSFNLRHTVNGASMQDSAFTGLNLATNDEVQVTLNVSKNAIIPGGISTTYKVYLHNPNGFMDDNQVNDTIT